MSQISTWLMAQGQWLGKGVRTQNNFKHDSLFCVGVACFFFAHSVLHQSPHGRFSSRHRLQGLGWGWGEEERLFCFCLNLTHFLKYLRFNLKFIVSWVVTATCYESWVELWCHWLGAQQGLYALSSSLINTLCKHSKPDINVQINVLFVLFIYHFVASALEMEWGLKDCLTIY